MSSETSSTEQSAPLPADAKASVRVCPRCSAAARREEARFCSACGCSLDEVYLPADALRASYNLHHPRVAGRVQSGGSSKPLKSSMASIFPAQNRNGASTTAICFVTYALVPYLGILFCPGAILMGGIGIFNSYRAPEVGGRKASVMSIAFGLLIFCAQLVLWWILYKIPEWTGG